MHPRGLHGSLSAICLLAFAAVAATAAPVSRDEALRAAERELPGFFGGSWRPAGEIALFDLSETVAAYAFIFTDASAPALAGAPEEQPTGFVARARAGLAAAGRMVTGAESELYGADRFATIVIAADDTEPVVLRCFRGLPPQLVKEADAPGLAGQGGGAWRVKHHLMLGFFDEAYLLENADGTAEQIVDLRTRSSATKTALREREVARKQAAADPERIRLCQDAWKPYRAAAKAGPAPAPKAPGDLTTPSGPLSAIPQAQ